MTVSLQSDRTGPRVPPSNLEAEESVLGSVMLSPDAANVVMEMLQAEDFYKPAHQVIFEAMVELYNRNQPIDAVTVSDALRRGNQLERIGGISYLTGLLDAVPATSNAGYYAGIIEEHGQRRRLVRAGSVIGELAFDTHTPVGEILDRAEQTVFAVAEHRIGDGLVPVRPLLTTALETIEEMGARGSEITGLSTGFRDLDRKLAGLQPANLVIIAARPSMGKSALAVNIAQNVAAQGSAVAIFSLEMSRQELVHRMLCSLGRVDSQKLRTGQLGQQHWQKIVRAAAQLFEVPIFLDDSPSLTATDLRARCRRLKRQQDLGLVVVDYLQLMQSSGRAENRQQEIAEISRSLKGLARELQVPIIAVSQLNRALETRQDKRPLLGDLRESGSLEQDSDVVLFIYRDEYYHPENQEAKGLAEVIVAKHRSGATGRIDMTFLAEFTLFADLGRDVAA
ncbi:MAG: replicative DNA helicase [Actinomycetota bacterium]|nr:replicative DNA helicase [Actinomycetota bacterium]